MESTALACGGSHPLIEMPRCSDEQQSATNGLGEIAKKGFENHILITQTEAIREFELIEPKLQPKRHAIH